MLNIELPYRRTGISLLELILVISIIGVMAGMLLTGVQRGRAESDRAACADHLRQVAVALHLYHDANNSFPGAVAPVAMLESAINSKFRQEPCWPVHLLPYIEQTALADATNAAFASEPNPKLNPPHIGFSVNIPLWNCPSDYRVSGPVTDSQGKSVGIITYFGISKSYNDLFYTQGSVLHSSSRDVRGVFPIEEKTRISDISDGTSQTLMLGERPADPGFESGWWYIPNIDTQFPTQPVLAVVEATTAPQEGGLRCSPNGEAEFDYFGSNVTAWAFIFGPGRIDNPCDSYHFWSLHLGGANFAFADGSVRFLHYSANDIMQALATRAGGESVELP